MYQLLWDLNKVEVEEGAQTSHNICNNLAPVVL